MPILSGLHHMSAICDDAQTNVDFYTGVLGLRLVKLTVNFDDPGAYHLYYGDGAGTPGSILTFFPYPGGATGRTGPGAASVINLTIPVDSVDFWLDRLGSLATLAEGTVELSDPDGICLRLVPDPAYRAPVPVATATVPAAHAIGRMHGIVLDEAVRTETERTLMNVMGFRLTDMANGLWTYEVGDGGPGTIIQIREGAGRARARGGAGTVHHIAFRTADHLSQLEWRERLLSEGFHVSQVMDRDYFQAIYFREPGGVLFEIATDPPGFTADERLEELGTSLKLPPQFEADRAFIEAALPPLKLPG